MEEYREYISALKQCAKEHENDNVYTGQIDVSALCNDTAKLLENDVIERSKVDKAIEEIQNANVCECHCITCIRTEDVLEILRRI